MPVTAKIPKDHEAALRQPWDAFAAFVGDISARLASQPPGDALDIEAGDGDLIGRVGLADVRRKFDLITWSLTTKVTTNGGVGAVTSTYKSGSKPASWLSGSAAFHVDGFRDYAAFDEQGLHYLALHETSHVTLLGLQVQDACWRKFLKGKGKAKNYPGSDFYIYNEQVANEIVRTLAARLGVATLAAPTYGSPPARLKLGLKVV